MQPLRIGSSVPAVLLLVAASACATVGEPATPQRPTVSSNTSTTSAGTFELEAGVTAEPGDSLDIPTTLKYGIDERTEAFVGFSPYRWVDRPGDDGHGIGDLSLGARRRFVDETESGPAVAGLTYVKFPTADEDEGVGSGEFDAAFAAIIEKNIDRFDLVGYAQLDLRGDPSGGIDLGQTFALAASTPLDDQIGVFSELSGTFVPEQDIDAILLLTGLTWANRPDLVLDFSFGLGLGDDAPDFLLLLGFTRNFGR